jgi:hypothetical protein
MSSMSGRFELKTMGKRCAAKKRREYGRVAVLVMAIAALCSCGGGSSGGNDPVTISPKTATLLVGAQDSQSVPPSGQQQFQAVISGSNSSAVDWLVNGILGGNSVVGTISTTGLYVVPDEVPSTPITVIVRSREDFSVTDSASVTLQYPTADAKAIPTPRKIQQGSSATAVIVTGGPFSVAAKARVNGNSVPTTRISKTEISVLVPASQLTEQNSLLIQVENPQPGGGASGGASLFVVAGSFAAVGNINTPRQFHTATLLPDGKVLIAGGKDASGNLLTSAELFDPQTNTFHATGAMSIPRAEHSAVLLRNGKILIAGGRTFDPAIKSAELYDPNNGTFTTIASQTNSTHSNVAALLSDGRVLLQDENADIYDPDSNTFAVVTSGNDPLVFFPRPCAGAVTLGSGQTVVLQNGGIFFFDPMNLTYTPAENQVSFGVEGCSLTALADGTLLVAGGVFRTTVSSSGTVWNPVTPQTKHFQFAEARSGHAAVQLQNGQVLFAGGVTCVDCVELFDPQKVKAFIGPDPVIHLFNPIGRITTATLLRDGRVLVVGDRSFNPVAQVYIPPAP